MTSPRSFLSILGPGLLFAGAAVGVSHLVQSTRAGAMFGLGMIGFVILANVIKYPAFAFGPLYAAATGTSLLEGYRKQGPWALWLYGVLTVGTMFTVQAAVTHVTAGLARTTLLPGNLVDLSLGPVAVPPRFLETLTALLPESLNASVLNLVSNPLVITPNVYVAAVLLLACGATVAIGGYRWLDRIIKVVVVVLTLSTLVATLMSLTVMDSASLKPWPASSDWTRANVLFLAGLIGWMPCAIDASVWHSLWTLARSENRDEVPHPKEALLDFNVGYIGTAMLAICFLTMGASVMHGREIEFQNSTGAFAGQVIALYTTTLGEWAGPIIGLCAFTVMLSTTLTVLDGFARALAAFVDRVRGPEVPGQAEGGRAAYIVSLIVIGSGSLLLLQFYIGGLLGLVTLATTLSFLTGPILAWLNHRAICGEEVPEAHRPGERMRLFSLVCVGLLTALALIWIVAKFAIG